MTLQDLAEKCTTEGRPVRQSQLSKIERGIHTPHPQLRVVLVRILGLDEDYFDSTGPSYDKAPAA